MKHPLDIINERLTNGYYDKLPPGTYSKDVTTICYLLGYCSKIDYEIAKAKYEQINSNKETIKYENFKRICGVSLFKGIY